MTAGIIRTPKEFEEASREFEPLFDKAIAGTLTDDEKWRYDTLALFLLDYESRTSIMPDVAPHELVKYSLGLRGLPESDVYQYFDSADTAKAFLAGNYILHAGEMARLHAAYHIPVSCLIPALVSIE